MAFGSQSVADDAAVVWNAFEILLAECFRRLESHSWREHFSPRLLGTLETLANRASINSPARFHQSPFNSETIVSLWCPWTIECTFAGTQSQFDFGTIRTTLEKWTSWGDFYKAGGEPDLVIRNQNLWPPLGADWEKRTGIRESECQFCLDSRDSRGLSNLFSESPRAFIFALGSWLKHLDEVFDIPNTFTASRELRGHVTKKHLADLRDALGLITEAHANVEQKSEVAKFGCSSLTSFDRELGTMLTYQERSSCRIDSHDLSQDSSIHQDCRYFETILMQSWLNELAHPTDRRPAGQIPALNDGRPRQLDAAARSLPASEEVSNAAAAPKADETIPLDVHNDGSALETKTDKRSLSIAHRGRRVEPDSETPIWSADDRTLAFNGLVVRQFSPQTGKPVLSIMNAFEECDWPNRIDDPLSPPDAEKTKLALRTINSGLHGLRFSKDGDGIKWEVIRNSR